LPAARCSLFITRFIYHICLICLSLIHPLPNPGAVLAALCLSPLIFHQELDSGKDENAQGFRPPQGVSGLTDGAGGCAYFASGAGLRGAGATEGRPRKTSQRAARNPRNLWTLFIVHYSLLIVRAGGGFVCPASQF
jgi:hypothetical protein